MFGLSNEGEKYYKLTEIIKQRRNLLKVPVIDAFTLGEVLGNHVCILIAIFL